MTYFEVQFPALARRINDRSLYSPMQKTIMDRFSPRKWLQEKYPQDEMVGRGMVKRGIMGHIEGRQWILKHHSPSSAPPRQG